MNVFRKNQQGSMLFIMSIALILVGLSLVRGTELLTFMGEKEKGKALGGDTLTIIKAWSDTMDYKCVVGDNTTVVRADLELSDVTKSSLTQMSLVMTPQPFPQIEISIGKLSEVANRYLLTELENKSINADIAPIIQVIPGENIRVIATRGLSAAEAATFGNAANIEAVVDTIMLGGIAQYGASGC